MFRFSLCVLSHANDADDLSTHQRHDGLEGDKTGEQRDHRHLTDAASRLSPRRTIFTGNSPEENKTGDD